jgi:hypothetical protein
LHVAAVVGHTDAVAALLEAGASVAAVGLHGTTCLSLAATYGHTAVVRQLLNAWHTPPADVLRKTAQIAARRNHCDAAVLLVKRLGKQDMAAAAELMRGMPAAVPALLDAVLGSEAEQQAAALQDEARQLAEQRRGLQVLVLGLAGQLRKQAAAGQHPAGPEVQLQDKGCGEPLACAAAAADSVVSVQKFVHVSAAAAEADDAGVVGFGDSIVGPVCDKPRVNKRKRTR